MSATLHRSPIAKRPTRRQIDIYGHVTVSGGDWACEFEDGRSFAHKNKALVTKLANLYAKGGEAAIAEHLAQ